MIEMLDSYEAEAVVLNALLSASGSFVREDDLDKILAWAEATALRRTLLDGLTSGRITAVVRENGEVAFAVARDGLAEEMAKGPQQYREALGTLLGQAQPNALKVPGRLERGPGPSR